MSRISIWEPTSREAAACQWVRRKLGSVAHELRVSQIARNLFSLTQHWHQLTAAEARLLMLAAIVHDVGRCEGKKGHAKAGARLILENTSLPLSPTDRRRLAFLTRYHRGQVPDAGTEAHLDHSQDDVRVLRTLLGLLRAADALDSRAGDGIQIRAFAEGRVLTVLGYVAGDCVVGELGLGKPRKFALLESTLACKVHMGWLRTDRLAMAS